MGSALDNFPFPSYEWLSDDYELEGVVTRVSASEERLADAVGDLLDRFRRHPSAPRVDPHIQFFLVSGRDCPAGLPPESDRRLLYEQRSFKYSTGSGSDRYVEVRSGTWAAADLDKNCALGVVDDRLADKHWLISRRLFYPLWAQMLKSRGLFYVHAAGLAKDGKGVLFPARSGGGKSVMALRLIGAGYQLLADDGLFLCCDADRTRLIGFPHTLNLREPALDLFPGLGPTNEAPERGWKVRLDVEQEYPGTLVDSARPGALVFPEIAGTAQSSCRPIPRANALVKLFNCSLFLPDPATCREHFRVLVDFVKEVDCFDLSVGTDGAGLVGVVEEMVA